MTCLDGLLIDSSQILAMSASPASTKERLNEIQKNLYIKHFELKDESSMKDFVKDKTQEKIFVELNDTQKEISKLFIYIQYNDRYFNSLARKIYLKIESKLL